VNRKPAPPETVPIAEVLQEPGSLARLVERLRLSTAMFEAVRDLFPAGLAASVRPGPIDEAGWSLLAANAAVGAKLRQLVPHLEARLRERGHVTAQVRIKIQP